MGYTTEQARAGGAPVEGEARFRAMFEQAAVGVARVALDGRWLDANRRLCELVGYTREELLAGTFQAITHPDDRAADAGLAQRVLAGEAPTRPLQKRYIRKDGSIVRIDLTLSLVRGQSNEPLYFVCVVEDIDARKRAETGVQEALDTLQQFLDSAPSFIAFVDAEGRYRAVNRRYEEWFGLPREQIVGRALQEIHRPATYAAMTPHIREVKSGRVARFGHEMTGRDGNQYCFDVQYVPRQLPNGSVIGYFVLAEDVTDRKHAEAVLAGQKRVLERIAASPPVDFALNEITRLLEEQSPGVIASILLLDEDGVHLRHGAAAGLPDSYVKAIDGVAIGPSVGSCGTAAFRMASVYVEDIATDPLWDAFKSVALPHGLRACWSAPIFDKNRRVLGTFAVYCRQPALPSPEQMRLIEWATHTAAIAIGQHRVGSALRNSEERLRLAINAASVGLWDWDLATNKVHFSREWKRQVGYGEHEIVDEFAEWERRVHPADLGPTMERVRQTLANADRPHEVEFRLLHKDGTWRWIYARGEVVRDSDGRPVRMLGCHVDITARKESEQRLAESERRFRTLVEGTDVIAWESDPTTHTFTYVSPQAARLGYPLEEWYTPDFWARHVHPEDRERAVAYCRAESAAGRSHRFQYRFMTADGRTVWIDDSVHVERIDGERWIERGVLVDVTEIKRIETAARQASEKEALATIAAGVAHEFNSLLLAASIQMHNADGAAGANDGPATKAREMIQQAQRLAAALLDLYAGPEAGQAKPLSLGEWLPATVSRLASGLPANIRVSTHVPQGLPGARAHALGLEQVVRNLLANAADAHGGDGGTCEVRVTAGCASVRGREMVELRVSDNGPGIPEVLRGRVFEPGFTTRTRSHRSGLGLAIAARLLEQFGGTLSYEPNTPKGSTFVVRLLADPGGDQ